MRKINDDGLNLIKHFESCRLSVYTDIAGHKTIGWGHMNDRLSVNSTITQEQADELLDNDLIAAECSVSSFVRAPLTDNQFASLVSLVFNVGAVNLKKSTLLTLLNARDYIGAAEEFPKWDRAGGTENKGLLERRNAERDLFLKA